MLCPIAHAWAPYTCESYIKSLTVKILINYHFLTKNL